MKKIEIIKKVTEINNSVVSACDFIANEDKFKTIIDKFFSEFGSDSDNFRSVMSYYHGGGRKDDFISGVNYYMNTMDEDDITCEQAREDLKVMKKLNKTLEDNFHISSTIKLFQMYD